MQTSLSVHTQQVRTESSTSQQERYHARFLRCKTVKRHEQHVGTVRWRGIPIPFSFNFSSSSYLKRSSRSSCIRRYKTRANWQTGPTPCGLQSSPTRTPSPVATEVDRISQLELRRTCATSTRNLVTELPNAKRLAASSRQKTILPIVTDIRDDQQQNNLLNIRETIFWLHFLVDTGAEVSVLPVRSHLCNSNYHTKPLYGPEFVLLQMCSLFHFSGPKLNWFSQQRTTRRKMALLCFTSRKIPQIAAPILLEP